MPERAKLLQPMIAADYMGMFEGFLKSPEMQNSVIETSKGWNKDLDAEGATRQQRGYVEEAIRWAKAAFHGNNAWITWYLRWVRLSMEAILARDLFARDLKAYVAKAGDGLDKDFRVPRLGEYSSLTGSFNHFMSLPCPQIQAYRPGYKSVYDVLVDLEKLEEEWKREQQSALTPEPEDEVLIDFRNGWAWWLLPRNVCSAEAKAMGHCGNGGNPREGERILSLRQKKNSGKWEPHLTFILDKNGLLGEMKGKGNDKPAPKYHSYILKLLENPIVTGIKGGGYLAENNFAVEDLTEEEKDQLASTKPNLLPILDYYPRFGMDDTLAQKMLLYLQDNGARDAEWNSEEKLFELMLFGGIEDIAERYGDRDTQTMGYALSRDGLGHMSSEMDCITAVFRTLPTEMQRKLGEIIREDYVSAADRASYDPSDPDEVLAAIRKLGELNPIYEALLQAYRVGRKTFVEQTLEEALTRAMAGMAFKRVTFDDGLPVWADTISPEEVLSLVKEHQDVAQYRRENHARYTVKATWPENIDTGFDQEDALGALLLHYDIDDEWEERFGDEKGAMVKAKLLQPVLAANYMEMFDGFLKSDELKAYFEKKYPISLPNDPDTSLETSLRETGLDEVRRWIQQQVDWAKKTFKGNSAWITWWCRWTRLCFEKMYTPELFERDRKAMSAKGGQEIEGRWEFPLGLGFLKSYARNFEHYMGTPAPGIDAYRPGWKSIPQVSAELQQIEKEWQNQQKSKLTPKEGDTILIQFPDGWAWWLLPRNKCEDESKAMGHCGNTPSQDESQRILSLRQPHKNGQWEPHLTFILEGNGFLGEMKGKDNDKPVPKYHPYIIALLKNPIVKGIQGGGYLPKHNFAMKDLTDEQRAELYEEKPTLLPLDEYYQRFGADAHFLESATTWLKENGARDPKWDEALQGFVLETFTDLKELVEDRGNDTAKWVVGVLSGNEDFFPESGRSTAEDAKEMLDDLPNGWIEKIGLTLKKRYANELPDWLDNEGEEEFDPTSEREIISFAEYVGEDELLEQLSQAYGDGIRFGAEAEMDKALQKALRDSLYRAEKPEHIWDSQWVEMIPAAKVGQMITEDYDVDDLRTEGDFKIEVDEPYYGWSDFDKGGAINSFNEGYDIDKKFEEVFGKKGLAAWNRKNKKQRYNDEFARLRDRLYSWARDQRPLHWRNTLEEAIREFRAGDYQSFIDLAREFAPKAFPFHKEQKEKQQPEPVTAAVKAALLRKADWTRAEAIRSGDLLAHPGPVFRVRRVYREGDEIVVIGERGVYRRFDPQDEVSVWRKTAAYNEDAWQVTQREHEGQFPAGGTDDDLRQHFQRGDEWKQSVLAALSLGKLTAAEARQRKLYTPDGVSPEEFKPLPSPLYHVTTALSQVRQKGLMSRWELAMDGGVGLGGGSGHSISFTTDPNIAETIYRAMILGQEAARGDLTLPTMLQYAEDGVGAPKPFIDEFRERLEGNIGDIDRALKGIKIENHMGYEPREGTGWEPWPESYHWTGGDGKERYATWQRPLTPDEAEWQRWQAFKCFLSARELAGGAMDPLFFCTNIKSLAKVDPKDIAILEYRPAPGAMGIQLGALGEWRIFSGKAVQFVRVVPPGTAKAAAQGYPSKLYHSSPQKNRKRIERLGLLARQPRGAGRGNERGVYGLTDPNDFEDVTVPNPVPFDPMNPDASRRGVWSTTPYMDIWEFDTKGLSIRPDQASGMEGSFYSRDDVPPSQVRLYRPGTELPAKQAAELREFEKAGIPQSIMEEYSYGYCTRMAIALNKLLGWPITVAYEGTPAEKHISHAWVESPDGRDLDIAGWGGAKDFDGVYNPALTERNVGADDLAKNTGATDAEIAKAIQVAKKYVLPGYVNAAKTASTATDPLISAIDPDDGDYAAMDELRSSLQFPLTVYRALSIPYERRLDTDHVGECWTYEEKMAVPYNGRQRHQPYVLRGVVEESAIDWDATFFINVEMHWSEAEIRLKEGAQVELTGIRRGDEKEWSQPEKRQVTASVRKEALVPNDIIWLKRYLTMSDRDKGEELARSSTERFREYVQEQDPDLLESLPFDEEGYLEDFSEVPDEILTGFTEYEGSYLMKHDPANAPFFLHSDYRGIVRNQWLIHFSDNAEEIAYQGFRYGMDDMRTLGLTTYFKDEAKKHGGYNFAFLLSDFVRHGWGRGRSPKYGSGCVLFRASGIKVYHYGDEEPQVIFWGKDARDIVPVIDRGGDWCLPEDDHGKPVYQSDDLEKVADWVVKNFPQYRKTLLGKKAAVAEPPVQDITETPQFKAWFAGSEVVDKQGKPLVMYHATQSGDIEEFRPYTHFGTQQAANDRHDNLWNFYNDELKRPDRAAGSNIMPVYLSVKNPLRLPDLASINYLDGEPLPDRDDEDFEEDEDDDNRPLPRGWEGEEAIAMTLYERGIMDIEEFEEHRSNDEALKFLAEQGYDGIVYENVVEDPGNDSWIVFNPNQIKSAIGNSGDFHPEKAKITAATQPLPPSAPGFQPWYDVENPAPQEALDAGERAVTDTENFSNWFAGSKCVDSSGRPLIVYHGTSSSTKSFTERNKGYGQVGHWFDAWPETVEGYTGGAHKRDRPNVIPAFLSIKNPKVLPDLETFKDTVNRKYGPSVASRCQKLRRDLKKAGFDGIVIRNSESQGGESPDYWVAFDTKQIKSAVGNSGEFSTEDKSITAAKTATRGPFRSALEALRPQMAAAAQKVYDEWQPGEDDDFGGGGICDEVAVEIGGVIVGAIEDVEIADGGQDGDDHAWVIVGKDGEAYGVDIPPNVYETGSGYNWTKIPDVTIEPEDIDIFPLGYGDVFDDGKTASKTAAIDGWLSRTAPGSYRGEFEGKEVEIYRAVYRGPQGGSPFGWTLRVDGQPMDDGLPSLRSAIKMLKERYAVKPATSEVIVEDGTETAKVAAEPPSGDPILVVVHPGSACGSADFNIGKYDAQASRDGLVREFENWHGGVIVLCGELDDELPDYPQLNAALSSLLERAKAAGKVSIRVKAHDPAQITVIKRLLKKPENQGSKYIVTGAWLYDNEEGCVGSVVQAIRSMGLPVTVSDMAVTDSEQPEEDDEEEDGTAKQAGEKTASGPVRVDDDGNYGEYHLTLEARPPAPEAMYSYWYVTATLNQEVVGTAVFDTHENRLYPLSVNVSAAHRRKGLATAMYQFAEKKTGLAIGPSPEQSSAGKALWEQPNRPFGTGPSPLAAKISMKINVPESEHEHFWEEPPPGSEEFWALRFPPKATVGDKVVFHMNKQPVAEAVISRIEKPGESECEQTGRFKHRWKAYFTEFRDLRRGDCRIK